MIYFMFATEVIVLLVMVACMGIGFWMEWQDWKDRRD